MHVWGSELEVNVSLGEQFLQLCGGFVVHFMEFGLVASGDENVEELLICLESVRVIA